MMRRRLLEAMIPVTGLMLVLATSAHGQRADRTTQTDSTGKSASVLRLDEVVVSVTRTGRSLRELPAHVSVLTEEHVKATSAQTVPDLLRHIPGFAMRDFQSSITAHPSRQAPMLRGLGGGTSASRTLVLVDGLPFDDPFGGWVHWARVPLDIVERVEVVRGGSSGVWGSRAMAGVINLITARPTDTGIRLGAQGGGMSTLRTHGTVTLREGPVGVAVMGEYFDSHGFRHVRPDLRGPIDTNAGSQHEMGFAKLEYEVSPDFTLHLNGGYFDEYRPNATPLRHVATTIRHGRTGARLVTGDQSVWTLTLHGASQDHRNVFSTEALDRTSEVLSLDQFDVPATALGGNFQWSRRITPLHEVTAGVDVLSVNGEVNEDYAYAQGAFTRRRKVGGEQVQSGFYVQDVFTPAARLRIVASARLDAWRNREAFRSETNLQNGSLLLDSTYAARSRSHFNYGLGVRHAATDRLAWRASVYAAYRAPTLNELYKPFREAGNVLTESLPSLEAERLNGAEAGIDVALSSAFGVHATAFWMRVQDYIADITLAEAGATGRNIAPCGFVPAGGVCRQRGNLEEFRSVGTELDLELRPHADWTLTASWLYNPTEIVRAPGQPQLEGRHGRAAARNTWSMRASYFNPSVVEASLAGRRVGWRFDDDANTLELDPFFVLEARVGRQIRPGLNAFLAVENLLDEQYDVTRAASGLVRIGTPRYIHAGVRLDLRRR